MLDQLISDISETLTNLRDDDLQTKMKSLLSTYQQSGDESWRKYKFSNPHSYSRNLVHISPLFEAILLVWDKGQISPIHNHNVCYHSHRCELILISISNPTVFSSLWKETFLRLNMILKWMERKLNLLNLELPPFVLAMSLSSAKVMKFFTRYDESIYSIK